MKTEMKANRTWSPQIFNIVMASAVLTAMVTTGCSKAATEGLSYAEALAIYNDEVHALDRLLAQRDTLQQELDSPPPSQYLDAAQQLLGDTSELSKQLSGTLQDLAGPTSALGGEEAQRRQDELVGSVTDQIEQAKASQQQKTQQWETRKKEISAKIVELDKQVVVQQKRVDRALADKDAAEAARR
jgi:hypothetical protein